MPCPFGFQAEAADNDGDVELESGGDDSGPEDELAEGAPVFCAGEALEGGDQLGGEEGGEQRVQARSSSVAAAGTVPKKKSRKSKESKKKASDAKVGCGWSRGCRVFLLILVVCASTVQALVCCAHWLCVYVCRHICSHTQQHSLCVLWQAHRRRERWSAFHARLSVTHVCVLSLHTD